MMVWSETLGAFIRLPADVVPGDGRNYIDIGEEIPDEIADQLTAGQLFYNGNPDPFGSDVLYYVIGIDLDGNLTIFARWRQLVFYDGVNPPTWAYNNEPIMKAYRGIGNDDPPYVSFATRLNQRFGPFVESEITRVTAEKIVIHPSSPRSVAITSFRTGWAQFTASGYETLRFSRLPDGMIHVSGFCTYNGGTGATVDICNLTGAFVPQFGHIPIAANVQDTFRWAEARTDGTLRLRGAVPTVGNFVSVNGTYPGAEF
jgi:hypothetical protein